MDEILEEIKKHRSYHHFMEKMALERMVHVMIESILDVGNMMIDGFIMRDPGSYEDIIDILIDEKVLPAEQETAFKDIVGWRKKIVNEYQDVHHEALYTTVNQHQMELSQFSKHIRLYLQNELGVANAFSNKKR